MASHGTADDTRYYKWDYDEVWEFHSIFESKAYFIYERDEFGTYQCVDVIRDGITYKSCVEPCWYPTWLQRRNDSLYICWKYQNSTNINIGSTAASSDNSIIGTVRHIENNAWELSWLYSILVKQNGISREGYEFYKILKGNSEGMGSIFDAQPSQMKTNLKCVTDPNETVVGFVDATSITTKRLFISAKEVPDWRYYYTGDNCGDSLLQRNYTFQQMIDFNLVPTQIISFDSAAPFQIRHQDISYKGCVDCRLRGIHLKPDF